MLLCVQNGWLILLVSRLAFVMKIVIELVVSW